jgi:TP901 family phage tail tape measure protein
MAITNIQLNAYIQTLAKVDAAIKTTISSLRSLETYSDRIGGTMGTALLPLENQITAMGQRLRALYSMKEQLLSGYSSGQGSMPFRTVGAGFTATPPGVTPPIGTGQRTYEITPYTNPTANDTQKRILSEYIAAYRDHIARIESLDGPLERQRTSIEQQIRSASSAAPAQTFNLGGLNALFGKEDRAIEESWKKGVQWFAQNQEWTTNKRYARSREYAAQAGFTGLPTVTQIGTSGVQQLDWKQVDELTKMTEKMRLFNTPAGGNIESTSRQFQTLTSAIGRDIRELTKWSIAIAVIYGPLNALKSLMADMVENETRLANAMIAVTGSTLRMGEIFNIAKQAADELGTGVSDTINSFTMAYRATGNLGSSFERITVGTQLLKDSLILAKLSGMEEAVAIDTLAASLRQTNTPLDEGASLLDKWIKTTQNANVDLATLATGFAVLGDAAETAGMNIDELNGLIAAIAETGIASGKEVANTAKAIVSGLYGEKSTAQIMKLGIATKDAEGNLRDFNSIATEIYQQRQLGLISDTAFQETARAIGGGGNRRQAAVTTLIENYARVQQVAALSATANGEAQEAMGRRLNTVQTASTRLNNSFQSLAATLGNEGGLLDLFGMILEVATGVTNVFDTLVSTMGKAGPMLMTVMAGGAILKMQGPTAVGAMGQGLDRLLMTMMPGIYGSTMKYSNPALGPSVMQGTGGRFVGNLLSGTPNLTNMLAGGLLAGVLPAIGNLRNAKEDPAAGAKAAANILGAAGGAIVSTLLGMSPIIGMAIGSAIGEAYISTVTYQGNISRVLAETGGSGYKTPEAVKFASDAGTEALFEGVGSGIGSGFGKLLSTILNLPSYLTSTPTSPETTAWALMDLNRERYGEGSPGARAIAEFNMAAEVGKIEHPENYNLSPFEIDMRQKEQMELYGPTLTGMRKGAEGRLLTQVQQKEITPAEFTRKMESLSTYEERATKFQATFGSILIGNVAGINSEMDAYQAFLNLITDGSSEAVDAITAMSSEIYDSKNKLEGLAASTALGTDLITLDGQTQTKDFFVNKLETRIAYLEGLLPTIVQTGNEAAQAALVNMPSIVNKGEMYSRADYRKIMEESRATEFAALKQLNPERTDAEINAYLDSQEEFGVYVEAFGKAVYELAGGTSEAWFKDTATRLAEEGITTTGEAIKATSPQLLDINSSQFPLLQMYTNQAMQALRTIPGFEPENEDLQVFGKDWIGGVIHGDQLALRLALEKLIGIEEKQLDGIYNLPDGSFFSVFLTQGWMDLMQKGGGGVPGVTGGGEERGIEQGGGIDVPGKYGLQWGGGVDVPGKYGLQWGGGIDVPKGKSGLKSRPFRAGPGAGGEGETLPGTMNWLETGIDNLMKVLPQLMMGWTGLMGLKGALPAGLREALPSADSQKIPKINLNLNTSTTVQLDGRVIASIVKTYLAADFGRTTSGYGKTTKDYIM